MQEQDLTRQRIRPKVLHAKQKKYRKKTLIVLLTVLVVTILVLVIVNLSKERKGIDGTWVYDEYTQYVFEKSGSGRLLADDVSYEYTYKVAGTTLIIDFTEDIVRDCQYTFSIDGAKLTLKGGSGTDGGTYTLNRK